MRYLSVTEIAKKWNVSERSVRNYCAQGRVPGAFLTGKTWNIPENAEKPERSNKKKEQPVTLLDILQEEHNPALPSCMLLPAGGDGCILPAGNNKAAPTDQLHIPFP